MHESNIILRRYFILSFSAAFLVLSTLFLLLMSAVHPNAAEVLAVEPGVGDTGYFPEREEALSVLFVGVSDDGQEASLFLLVRFDPARGGVPIVAFPTRTAVQSDGKTQTLAEVYRYGGADYARRALAATLGIDIDRYVRMDEAGFLIAAAAVGSVEYDLPYEIELFEGGAEMTLSPGIQLLDGRRAADILGHQNYPGGELTRCAVAAELTASIVNQRIDVVRSAVLDKIFEKIINVIETDISYADYDDRKRAAEHLAKRGGEPAVAIQVAGSFDENGERYILSDTFTALIIQTFA